MDFDLNFWAVLLCGVISMVVGGLWYGPLLGKPWMREMGFDKLPVEELERMKQKAMRIAYPQQFVLALVMAYVFAHILLVFEADSVIMGLQGAFWTWLGFIVPVKYGETLWGNKSLKLFAIDAIYYLVLLSLFAVVLVKMA